MCACASYGSEGYLDLSASPQHFVSHWWAVLEPALKIQLSGNMLFFFPVRLIVSSYRESHETYPITRNFLIKRLPFLFLTLSRVLLF